MIIFDSKMAENPLGQDTGITDKMGTYKNSWYGNVLNLRGIFIIRWDWLGLNEYDYYNYIKQRVFMKYICENDSPEDYIFFESSFGQHTIYSFYSRLDTTS